MSWSGFRKAFNRAGAKVMLKTGQLDASIDEEFNTYEKDFKLLETNANKISQELENFDQLIDQLLESQLKIVTTVCQFYADKGQSDDGSVANDLSSKLMYIKEDLLPQIDEPFQVTVLQPLLNFKELTIDFKNLIKKRQNKKLDYDLLSHKLNKLENELKLQHTQNLEKEKTLTELNKIRPQFAEISKVFLELNSVLKLELQQFISLRSSIIDPSFESFIKIQNIFFSNFAQQLESNLVHTDLDQLNSEMDDLMLQLKDLSNINLSASS